MPAIKGAREELRRLKLELAKIDATSDPPDIKTVKRRALLERQMLQLEAAVLKYDGD